MSRASPRYRRGLAVAATLDLGAGRSRDTLQLCRGIAAAVGFDRQAAYRSIRDVNPPIAILELSARSGEGDAAWLAFVEERVRARMNVPRSSACLALAGLVIAPLGRASFAQSYPSKPLRFVVGFTPGGPSDIIARVVGERLGARLGQSLVVDNRPGAGGNIAAEIVAKAAPDGYTLLLGNNSILSTNESLYTSLGYDPQKDFAPVTLIGSQANILVVNPSLKATSVAQLIALAKSQPGRLDFASSGYGSAAHLAGELFKSDARIDIVHVPYKGAEPALTDLIAGRTQMMFATALSVMPFIRSGQLRALAVTTAHRSRVMPKLPTVAESGLRGFEATTWHGIVVPAATPRNVIAKLNTETLAVLHESDVRAKLTGLGLEIVGSTPQQFGAFIRAEVPKWAAVIKRSGAQI